MMSQQFQIRTPKNVLIQTVGKKEKKKKLRQSVSNPTPHYDLEEHGRRTYLLTEPL